MIDRVSCGERKLSNGEESGGWLGLIYIFCYFFLDFFIIKFNVMSGWFWMYIWICEWRNNFFFKDKVKNDKYC